MDKLPPLRSQNFQQQVVDKDMLLGDVLGVSTIGNNSLGRNLRLSLVSIANTNEIILDNVQGDFITGVGHSLQFVNNNGITTALNYATGGNVLN